MCFYVLRLQCGLKGSIRKNKISYTNEVTTSTASSFFFQSVMTLSVEIEGALAEMKKIRHL